METQTFLYRTRIPAPAGRVFAWHAEAAVLERLTPPWAHVRLLERAGGLEPGARVVLEMRLGPLRRRWVAEHTAWIPGREFTDVQRFGPFAFWEHTHRFIPIPAGDSAAAAVPGPGVDESGAESESPACWLEDLVRYRLPGGRLAQLFFGWYVRRTLRRLFAFRHQLTLAAFASHP